MADKGNFPNFVIGGTGRAGTTSIFRYLAGHPEVCPSSVKEVKYFIDIMQGSPADLPRYAGYFSHCEAKRVRMEASPQYLSWADRVAENLYEVLPHAKLLFILRHPVERFFTVYRNEKNFGGYIGSDESFESFVEKEIEKYRKKFDLADTSRTARFLHEGNYAVHLERFLDVFPQDQIKVVFFDDIRRSVEQVMRDLCSFLDIDPDYYNNFNFSIENKTREFRFGGFHKAAYRLNRAAEGLLNRLPVVRAVLRDAYLSLNESNEKSEVLDSRSRAILMDFYNDDIERLQGVLSGFDNIGNLPEWVLGRQ